MSPNAMKSSWRPTSLIIGVIVLAALAVLAWRLFSPPAPPPAAAPDGLPAGLFKPSPAQLASLGIMKVGSQPFHSLVVTDGVIAYNEDALTLVFSPYSGRVAKIVAKPGDVVARGAPLLTVEASEYVQAVNDLIAAKAALDAAWASEKRQSGLFAAGAAAEKDLQQTRTERISAESAWAVARGQLRIFGKSEGEIEALGNHRSASDEAVITAPIAGTVTQRQVGVGQTIVSAAAGAANPLFTIGDLSTVWLVANVREADAPSVKVGQMADVTTLALPDRTFSGKVAWVGPALDPVTHRLPIRLAVRNPQGMLKPQMFARFRIITSEATLALSVPDSAVIHDGAVTRVFKLKGDALSGQTVRIGRHLDGMVEIVEGLAAGDEVVTAGALFIDRAASPD
jgi:cobalt-zinc-cadmium efflux system membrane fusion protein